jgi:hypothetical protein
VPGAPLAASEPALPARVGRRMRLRQALVALIVAVRASIAFAEDRVERWLVNGEAVDIPVVSVVGDDARRPDDVLEVGGVLLTRGSVPAPEFRVTPEAVYETGADGAERLVALRAAATPERVGELATDDLRALRGVEWATSATRWGARVAGALDPERCVVTVLRSFDEHVGALRDDLRFLSLGGPTSGPPHRTRAADPGPRGRTDLTRFRRLRFLRLAPPDGGIFADVPTDASPLAALVQLDCLVARERTWEDVAPLGRIVSLRALDLSGGRGFEQLEFVVSLSLLRSIAVDRTWVTDAAPLAKLPSVQRLSAHGSALEALPESIPALRSLDVGFARMSDARLDAFRRAHPRCAVTADSSRARLLATLAGVDAVRVRTGGLCHRDVAAERVLWSSADPDGLREVLDLLAIDDPPSPWRCMCCGGPTIEFLRGDAVLQAVTVHHGTRLRGADELWPTDVDLTDEAATRLCGWLAERGATEPGRQLAAMRAEAEAERRLRGAQDAILPEGVAQRIRRIPWSPEADAAADAVVVAALPERGRRLEAAFRVAAAGADLRATSGDPVTLALLRTSVRLTPVTELLAALDHAETDPALAVGAARWLLRGDGAERRIGATFAARAERAVRQLVTCDDVGIAADAVRDATRAGMPFAVELCRSLLSPWRVDTHPARPPTEVEHAAAVELARVAEREDVPLLRAVGRALEDPRGAEEIERRLRNRFPDLASD